MVYLVSDPRKEREEHEKAVSSHSEQWELTSTGSSGEQRVHALEGFLMSDEVTGV